MKKFRRIAVLKGGWSPEREVSLNSGAACAKALRAAGYDVVEIDAKYEERRDLARRLKDVAPDAVFNALHGQWGEDGCVQGLLEVMGIPYTHSGVLASALAMDKQRTKFVLADAGVPSPEGRIVSRAEAAGGHVMAPPYVIKPNAQGSSVGVYIIRAGDNRPPTALASDEWSLGEDVLVEKFIPGRELTVAVMGDRALCVTEITTSLAFYDYEAKYVPGGSRHILPADLPPAVAERCLDLALKAHQALGCRGVSRSDFRYDETATGEQLYFLEINTQPGMTGTSLVPEQAAHCGISFEALCAWIIEDASVER
ncbi:D-alanine--D-alanine ligase [Amphiplicatus metriothermophilus]|uniref:D-alanine--D-alanine ligase n=1 Tax=Amphiplicatus metriothermophilus TaxID=1519374 RepID=A0A239PTV4_9PROT|nr:D-alanine--D-alanine ligase [Amphiplicatus metriothermophilus]MBB5519257.1 D-alanine-D-alanine ligase [Amphiplicatus metriothermophilus]SNT73326.1 D-alanine--D-alanine ligase [Amphiplicatus metriothermophilus]